MVVQPGLVVSGHGAIREVFTQLSHHGMCAVQNRVATLASGDTALFLSRWELRRPDGTVSHHTATSVLRRGLDRRWRIQIDNAFGPEVLGPVLAQCRIIPPEAGELARVLGTEVLIKLRSGESGGVISLVTTREDEGSGPPPPSTPARMRFLLSWKASMSSPPEAPPIGAVPARWRFFAEANPTGTVRSLPAGASCWRSSSPGASRAFSRRSTRSQQEAHRRSTRFWRWPTSTG